MNCPNKWLGVIQLMWFCFSVCGQDYENFNYLTLSRSFFVSDFLSVFVFGFLPIIISANKPAKTRPVPSHWRLERLFPKNSTEQRTVKNFLVVVTMEHDSGPKCDTIIKMKSCPSAPAKASDARWINSSECFKANTINSFPSPVIRSAVINIKLLHEFIDNIMYCADGFDAALIRS